MNNMMTIKCKIFGVVCLMAGLTACTDLDEKVYDRIDASVYYQNEASVKGAVAAIYNQTSQNILPTRLPGAYGTVDSGDGTRP